MKPAAWLALVLVALLAATPATAKSLEPGIDQAKARSVSYSLWSVTGATLRMRLMIPVEQTAALVPPGAPKPHRAEVADAVLENLTVTSAAGPCYPIDQGQGFGEIYTMALMPGLHRFEVVYSCPTAERIVLHDAMLFKRLPGHINYARIQIDGARPMLRLFTAGKQEIALPTPGAKPKDEPVWRHVEQGARRIVLQLDGLGIVLGVLLLVRRWRDLAAIGGALAAGYAAAIGIALTNLVAPDQGLADVVTGVLLALLGAGALRLNAAGPAGGRAFRLGVSLTALGFVVAGAVAAALKIALPGALAAGGVGLAGLAILWAIDRRPGCHWLLLAAPALFALLDGAGAGETLDLLRLPALQRLPVLAGAGLGAVGAIVAVLAVLMALFWLLRIRLSGLRNPAADLAGAALIGAGVFWFVSRLYS